MFEPSQLHVVELTPPGRGAVATLLIEGPGAAETIAGCFQPNSGRGLAAFPADRLVVGRLRLGSGPGEEVVIRRRSAESIELHCHGGHATVTMIEKDLAERGCPAVGWRDWALQHYDDPITADAHLALADARTERTAAILLDQYRGALRQAVTAIQQAIGDHDAARAGRQLETLLARARLGRHLSEPWRVVLAGQPNVGKSSLINALVGYPRAIVHHTPGTTCDVVTATTAVDGWPVELSDTAGLQETRHPVEGAGVERARAQLATADLVVLVFDINRPWTKSDDKLMASWPSAVVVHNKCDLAVAPGRRPWGLPTSALRGDGVDQLVSLLADRLVPDPPRPGAAVPFTSDQVAQLESAAEAVSRGDFLLATSVLAQEQWSIQPPTEPRR